jgi:hypothetical protein
MIPAGKFVREGCTCVSPGEFQNNRKEGEKKLDSEKS